MNNHNEYKILSVSFKFLHKFLHVLCSQLDEQLQTRHAIERICILIYSAHAQLSVL